MSIEERAREYCHREKVENVDCLHAYTIGAFEQRAIDAEEREEILMERDAYYDELLSKRQRIAELEAKLAQTTEKACKFWYKLTEEGSKYHIGYPVTKGWINKFRKAMEEKK